MYVWHGMYFFLVKFLKGMPLKEILNVKLKQIKKIVIYEKKNIID